MRYWRWSWISGAAVAVSFVLATAWSYRSPSESLQQAMSEAQRYQVLDRHGEPLSVTYQNRLNLLDPQPLHRIPEFLQQAMVQSEDRRFFEHEGVDWQARLSAIWQNIQAGKAVRGASTITEQVVRILHPRPRTLWSRWLEGLEAAALEQDLSKGQILEFYLNQLPYAANRRGVAQAARYYFNRDLTTLTKKEMLALAVLPRAPSAWDLHQHPERAQTSILRLAKVMQGKGQLTEAEYQAIEARGYALQLPSEPVDASHFIQYLRETVPSTTSQDGKLRSSLDANLQRLAQRLLDERLAALKNKVAHNGGALVVDHATGEILAWAVAGAGNRATPSNRMDAVRVLRQPGSSLKPFLYAAALEKGWTAATVLDDSPMGEAVGTGLHRFRNYSNQFYGPIRLREALGNSLNIPALATIQYVGYESYLSLLHRLGFASLTRPAEIYKDGLALGNGEVSLLELVQAYTALARQGEWKALTPLMDNLEQREKRQVYSPEVASLVANILSDPWARRREFGMASVLNLPVQTAIKTGTSTDYRDAWVVGFNSRYTVGVWIGNLDRSSMHEVTGSTGPALVMRGLFSHLAQCHPTRPLWLSPQLVQQEVCADPTEVGQPECYKHSEYFLPGHLPRLKVAKREDQVPVILRPTKGLQMAYDPRLPAEAQAFEFVALSDQPVQWVLDEQLIASTPTGRFTWPLQRGHHRLKLVYSHPDGTSKESEAISFRVK